MTPVLKSSRAAVAYEEAVQIYNESRKNIDKAYLDEMTRADAAMDEVTSARRAARDRALEAFAGSVAQLVAYDKIHNSFYYDFSRARDARYHAVTDACNRRAAAVQTAERVRDQAFIKAGELLNVHDEAEANSQGREEQLAAQVHGTRPGYESDYQEDCPADHIQKQHNF